jgi:transposase
MWKTPKNGRSLLNLSPFDTLKHIVYSSGMTNLEMEKRINELENQNAVLEIQNAEYKAENERLMEIIRNFQRRHFKSQSEQSGLILQLNLFNEAETIAEQDPESPDEEIIVKEHTRKKKSGIKDSDIRVEEIDHPAKDIHCPSCGAEMKEVGTTVIEKLVYRPAEWVRQQHVIHIFECPDCCDAEGNATKAVSEQIPELIKGARVTPSVFSYIFNEKFLKAVPLYRIESSLFREGVCLSRQTMSDWFLQIVEIYISILITLMREDLMKEDIYYGDETTVKCLEEKEHVNNYMWLQCTGPYAEKQIVLYTYHDGRDGEFCKNLYEGFTGYLHCDAYTTYHSLEGIIVVACWDHVRRKVVDALAADVVKTEYDKLRTKNGRTAFLETHKAFALKIELFELINELYSLERTYRKKGLSPEERFAERNIHSKEQLDKIRKFLDANLTTFAESSKMYEAIHYADNNWPGLCTFLKDGRLELSNGRAERAIKDFVIGRKNWLFNSTKRGAQASADAYSLAMTIKENNLHPQKYIEYVLTQMMSMKSPDLDKYRELLPYSKSLPDNLRINRKKNKANEG